MEELLSDTSKFKHATFQHDCNQELRHILDMEKAIYDLLKDLQKNDYISSSDFSKLFPKGSQPGILYWSAKVHKTLVDNIPKFRPVLSAVNTSSYNIAKYLVPLLSVIATNELTISDSFSFAKELIHQDYNLVMASLQFFKSYSSIHIRD